MTLTNMNDVYYKEITLNSADLRTGSIDRPIFQFDTFMDTLDTLSISRVILPTTYYVFTSPNYVSMTINGTNYSWAAGNYTTSEWIAALAVLVPSVLITYSSITGLLTFTAASVNISFNSANEFAWQLLGFASAAGTNGAVAVSFTCPFAAQFSGPNFCYLRAKIASVFNGANLYFSRQLGDNSQEDKLLMVPIDQNRNSVVFYITVADRYFDWADSSTRQLEFYFTLGNRTELMSFNGVPFQIVLTGYSSQYFITQRMSQNINVYKGANRIRQS